MAAFGLQKMRNMEWCEKLIHSKADSEKERLDSQEQKSMHPNTILLVQSHIPDTLDSEDDVP
jgi:hypothetical protein